MRILEQFDTDNYTWRLYIVQNLCGFWAQNMVILRMLLKFPDQIVSILLWIKYITNIRTVWHWKLYMKSWYISKSLRILTIFLVWHFWPKMLQHPQAWNVLVTQGAKMFQYPHTLYYLCWFYGKCWSIFHFWVHESQKKGKHILISQ